MTDSGRRSPAASCLTFFLVSCLAVDAATPRKVTWSNTSYGPDGPWQAITVEIGTPAQSVDAYPGGFYESLILAPEICDHPESEPTCYAADAGLYSPANSTSAYETEQVNSDKAFGGTQALTGNGRFYLDTYTLPGDGGDTSSVMISNVSTFVVTQGYKTFPSGKSYSAALGNIGLGAGVSEQSLLGSDGTLSIDGSLIPWPLFNDESISSASFGLHIGSAMLQLPGSLYLGGYDQTRIVGPVSGQAYGAQFLPIDLLDIGIDVATGDSPFNFTSKYGLLAQGNSSLASEGSLEVRVTPIEPYLYLPSSTCEAIAAELPVSYSAALGLYLWDTTSALYETIVSSPSYLSFTFRYSSSDAQNLTIKVPFMLLNLTLEPPLVATPAPYLPCSLPTVEYFSLGRAFLQAAFMGINFRENYGGAWFLAQAPGPNISSSPSVMSVATDDNSLEGSSLVWADTWSGIWTPINSKSTATSTSTGGSESTTNSGSDSSQSGVSTGLVAGLSVGLSLLAFAVVGGSLWLRRMRKRKQELNAGRPAPTPPMASFAYATHATPDVTKGITELEGHHMYPTLRAELTGLQKPAELNDRTFRAELPGESIQY